MARSSNLRDKMVGMMYLVLTALLALQVSGSVLEKFVILNQSLQESVLRLNKRNEKVLSTIQKTVENVGNRKRDLELLSNAENIRKETYELYQYISKLKEKLVENAGGYDQYGVAKNLKDEEVVANLMLKQKESSVLEKKLNEYVNKISELMSEQYSHIALSVEHPLFKSDPNQKRKKFPELYFESTPLCAALATLTHFSAEVLSRESIALEHLLDKLGSGDLKFDTIIPVVKPKANIVPAGTKYEAELLLTASSSGSSPTMKIDKVAIPVTHGIGKISFMTTPGEYDQQGLAKKSFEASISMKLPSGQDTTFVERIQYFVAKPVIQIQSASVQALYLNCGNELNINVPALGMEFKPKFTATGGLVISSQKSKDTINIIPNTSELTLNVYNENALLGTQKFKVRNIPKPEVAVTTSGKLIDEKKGLDVPGPRSLEVKIIPDKSFKDFLPKDARYRVVKWEVTLARGSRPVKVKKIEGSSEANLNDLAPLVKPGDRIVIEVLKVERKNFKDEIEQVELGSIIKTIPIN